ncbi:MarP family serine protease [Nocardioides sp. Kera G14]|uniref:MarP family serine protease n=1 Tax=Nocardioides sp. Kera G14 TaxID=2884264 RepID=UPI001D10E21A|nr:MarP family serine protease [Nocardioides sp. Kera G14]UDY23754.1 MarP family serine protease [Nocardioides sp. Kera G14]
MNWLDWCLVLLVAAYALSGYWQGFISGAFATVGLLLGGFIGVWAAPKLLGDASPSVWVSLGALFVVILAASLGQGILQYVGTRVRNSISWRPVRALDACGGAVLSAAAVLVVAWALGVAISGAHIGPITSAVRGSTVLSRVDDVMPLSAAKALDRFNNVVGTSFFPRYLEPFAPERIVRVGPGPARLKKDPDVVRAEASVFKVRGANSCGRGVEGTGFLIAPGYLMTNAHVVAGVSEPVVSRGNDEADGKVVLYDPGVDIAVVAFDSGSATPLDLASSAKPGDGVAILGYPQDGPFDIEPGRIRAQQRLRSPDIYGSGTVIRDVYSLRGLIRPGNSGGPIVDSAGQVAGVVFAASVTDKDTGYALTANQVSRLAEEGKQRTTRVSTGGCA